MADTTATYLLPYPESTDAPEVWTDMQALAEAVDDKLGEVDGRIVTAASGKPVGRIRQGTAQTGIVNSTTTAITFAAADEIDTGGFHNPASNNDRVIPTVAGIYRVTGGVSVAGNTDFTQVQAFITRNGSALAPANRITPGTTAQTLVLPVSCLVVCNGSTDYFGISYQATRSGAGTSATAVSSQFASVLEWEWVRS